MHARNPKQNPPPDDLRHAFYTNDYGPPFAGGWRDWPAGYIDKMRYVYKFYKSAQVWKQNSKNPEWIIANPDIAADISKITKIEQGEFTGDIFLGIEFDYG